jgi:hypothetical protein
MNLRQFSIAVLVSALPIIASADPSVSFDRGDFKAAKKITRDGETVLSVKLSKSGKAKLKKISVGKNVHTEIGGVESGFKLRESIKGDDLVIGPYTTDDAEQVVSAINDQ